MVHHAHNHAEQPERPIRALLDIELTQADGAEGAAGDASIRAASLTPVSLLHVRKPASTVPQTDRSPDSHVDLKARGSGLKQCHPSSDLSSRAEAQLVQSNFGRDFREAARHHDLRQPLWKGSSTA